MKRILMTLSLAAMLPHALADGAGSAWTVAIQQGKNQYQGTDPIRLQREPFSILFTGPPKMRFAALAATSCTSLERLKTPDQMSRAIRPTNTAAEGAAADNTWLFVNSSSAIASDEATAHVWAEDKEKEMESFQDRKKVSDGRMLGTRKINEILTDVGGKTKAVQTSKYQGTEICLLLSGLPPGGPVTHTQPTLIRIAFE